MDAVAVEQGRASKGASARGSGPSGGSSGAPKARLAGTLRAGSRAALVVLLAVLAQACATGAGPEEVAERERIEKQAKAKYNLGMGHLRRGRTEAGLRELLKSAEMRPDDPWTHLSLGEAYRRKGRTEESIHHLQKVLELEPDRVSTLNQTARLNLSGIHIQRGEYAQAAELARGLVEEPTFEAPWRGLTNLGWAQYRLGQLDEAQRHLEQAVQYNPRYWPALLNLGILEDDRGRRLEALRLFKEVLALEPGPYVEAEVHYRTAEIFIALGEQEKALPHLVASAEVEPKGTWSRKSEEYLELLR